MGAQEGQFDAARLILIVVGAHLRAEVSDRPVAYALRERMAADLSARGVPDAGERVVVCTDLWYLNNEHLRGAATVSIGGPGVNALSAYLAGRLPSAFSVEGALVVQGDPEFHDAVACCWGTDGEATGAAVGAFVERYLPDFLGAATKRWG